MKVKHILLVRFFPFQIKGFIYDTKDALFLKKQAKIFKTNLLSTLENQTNKDFVVVIIVNRETYERQETKDIINDLKESSPFETEILPCFDDGTINGFTRDPKYIEYLTTSMDGVDYLIESRTDFDDFVHKDASLVTKQIVEKSPKGLFYHGYCKGLTYVNDKEMYLFDYFTDGQKRSGHWAIFTSIIINCKDMINKPFMSIYGFNHGNPKGPFTKYGLDNGIETTLIQDDLDDAFIYIRHDSNWATMGKNEVRLPGYARVRKYTEQECEQYKKIFASRFGFKQS